MPKKNPKLSHEQWLEIQKDNIKMIVELQQENEKLKEEVEELKAKKELLEDENTKLRGKDQPLEETADEEKKMRKVKEANNKILLEFMERQILDLEEDLECPVCLEVASDPPIFKCPDNHLICRICRPKLWQCPQCRVALDINYEKFRMAERQAEKLLSLRVEKLTISTM